MECPICYEAGCHACNNGRVRITQCPKRYVGLDDDVWSLLNFAEYAKNGSWPIAGGTLNQSAMFLRFCQWVWSDEEYIKASFNK